MSIPTEISIDLILSGFTIVKLLSVLMEKDNKAREVPISKKVSAPLWVSNIYRDLVKEI